MPSQDHPTTVKRNYSPCRGRKALLRGTLSYLGNHPVLGPAIPHRPKSNERAFFSARSAGSRSDTPNLKALNSATEAGHVEHCGHHILLQYHPFSGSTRQGFRCHVGRATRPPLAGAFVTCAFIWSGSSSRESHKDQLQARQIVGHLAVLGPTQPR